MLFEVVVFVGTVTFASGRVVVLVAGAVVLALSTTVVELVVLFD